MRIVPRTSLGQDFERIYQKAVRNVVVVSRADPYRALNLRCSGLPFCPLEFFYNQAISPGRRHLDMSGLFYTTVGTAVHDVMQTALMQSTRRIVGNWHCKKCGKTRKLCFQTDCCDAPMTYDEIDINYKGVQGHVDTVVVVKMNGLEGPALDKWLEKISLKEFRKHWDDAEFAVVDYKTCSLTNQAAKLRDPGSAYKEQVYAYALLLRLQYGMRVNSAVLFFVPRDNFAKARPWETLIGKQELKETKQRISQYLRLHKRVLRLKKFSELMEIYEEFGTCTKSYCDVCKKSDVKATLRTAFNRGRSFKALPLIDYIQRSIEKRK